MLGVQRHLKPTFVILRGLLLAVFAAVYLAGCTQQANRAASSSTSKTSTGASTTSTATGCTTSFESDCAVFASNSSDYALCSSCRVALCPTSGCCSVTVNQLAGCVHTNSTTAGGSCIGLQCGQGQIADLTSCTCKDGTTPSTIGAPPGYEDSLSPSVQVGLSIGNRYCPLPQGSSTITSAAVAQPWDCIKNSVGGVSLTTPTTSTLPPANVFTDIGYVRWDLGLDASQVPLIDFYLHHAAFLGSHATLPGKFTMSYQLKPNTQLCPAPGGTTDCSSSSSSYAVDWRDCVEHFSGYQSAAGLQSLSTPGTCDTTRTPQSVSLGTPGTSGTVTLKDAPIALNGPPATLPLANSSSANDPALLLAVGAGKADLVSAFTANLAGNSGLFSNIGYYKYSWGSMQVRRPNTVVDVASTSVTGSVAVNTNLGYSPISAVDSTAFSAEAINGELLSNACTSTTAVANGNSACNVTGVYRSVGGGILFQNFSPTYANQASPVGTLPSGITAAGTPQIIEDRSQMDTTSATLLATTPPVLRVFSRATDGNIYMSKGKLGVWSNWVSLGRPWLADTTTPTTGTLQNYVSAAKSAVYWPYLNQGNMPATNYTGALHSGISIAGEPVVVSYTDTDTSQYSTTYAAVLVRVSHMNCNAANACTPSTFHNAIFWTFGISNGNATSSSLDNISNWSPWAPVYDHTGALFQVQGSPLAFMRKPTSVTSNALANYHVTLYLVGTEQARLHPPIGPSMASDYSAYGSSNWFNYGTSVIYTSYQFEKSDCAMAAGTYVPSTNDACRIDTPQEVPTIDVAPRSGATVDFTAFPNILRWNHIERQSPANRLFVSDWSLATVDTVPETGWTDNPGATSGARIYAYALRTNGFSTNAASLTEYTALSPTGTISHAPLINARMLYYFDIQPTNGDSVASSGLAVTLQGDTNLHAESTRHLWGTPHPVVLSATSTVNGSWWPDVDNDGRTLLFTRATCTEDISCDHVNPTVAYVGLPSTIAMAGNHTIYFSGNSKRWAGTLGGVGRLLPYYATSDVIPIHSAALKAGGGDVPIYVFTRNIQGKLSVGTWGTKNTGASGVPVFQFLSPGAVTN